MNTDSSLECLQLTAHLKSQIYKLSHYCHNALIHVRHPVDNVLYQLKLYATLCNLFNT